MDTSKAIGDLLKDVMRLRRYLQESRALTPEERQAIKTELTALLYEVDTNVKRGHPPH